MVGGGANEENMDSDEGGEIAIGQRTYYRKRFLGKVRES
jgi:hypothetical protein